MEVNKSKHEVLLLSRVICNKLEKNWSKYANLVRYEREQRIASTKYVPDELSTSERKFKTWYEDIYKRLLELWLSYGSDFKYQEKGVVYTLSGPSKLAPWLKSYYKEPDDLTPDGSTWRYLCEDMSKSPWLLRVPNDIMGEFFDRLESAPSSLEALFKLSGGLESLYFNRRAANSSIKYVLINLIRLFNRVFDMEPLLFYGQNVIAVCSTDVLVLERSRFEDAKCTDVFDYIMSSFPNERDFAFTVQGTNDTDKDWDEFVRVQHNYEYDNRNQRLTLKLRHDSDVITVYGMIFHAFIIEKKPKREAGLLFTSRFVSRNGYRNSSIKNMFNITAANTIQIELPSNIFARVISGVNLEENGNVSIGKNTMLMTICTLNSVSSYTNTTDRLEEWISAANLTLKNRDELLQQERDKLEKLGWRISLPDQMNQWSQIDSNNLLPPKEILYNITYVREKITQLDAALMSGKLYINHDIFNLMVDDPYNVSTLKETLH